MSPVIRECQRRGIDYFILHSGQHYSYEMDGIFFAELGLPDAKYNLDVGSGSHAEETAKILTGAEKIMAEEKPDIVLVEGDTNTVLAAALAAVKLGIKVGHVEAGLRSGDRSMPEEINRCLTDHISDYLFAPTEEAKQNLLAEGIDAKKIFFTGNTIVDAVYQGLDIAKNQSDSLSKLNLKKGGYFVVTAHRQENVDVKPKLKGILDGLKLIYDRFNLPVVFSIHPRTRKKLDESGLDIPDGVRLITPPGFIGFLQLEEGAKLILTDSGGVQEEACILRVPCVTLRENTERPETLQAGANILAGTSPEKILECAETMLGRDRDWQNPFGGGDAAKRIIEVIA